MYTPKLKVNLIVIVRNQDRAGNDASARCNLCNNIHMTEQDIEVRPDLWGIARFCKGELGTLLTILDVFVIGDCPVGRR